MKGSEPPPAGPSRLAADLVTSAFGLIGTRAFGLVGGILLARLLPPVDRGEFGLVALAALTVGTASTLGAEYWITAQTATGLPQDRIARVAGHRIRTAAIALVVGAMLAAAIPLLRPYAAVGAAWALANVFSMLLLAQLGGQRRLRQVAVAQVTGSAAFAAGIALLLVGDVSVVWVALSVAAASTGLLGVLARRPGALSLQRAERADLADARSMGLPAMFGEVAGLFANRVSLVLIGAVLSAGEVGLFVVALSIAEMLLIVPNAISQVLLPQVAADGHGRATGPLVALNVVVGIVGVAAIYLFGEFLMEPVFGMRYGSASEPLLLLGFATLATGTTRLLLADLAGRGNTVIRLQASLLAGVVIIVLDLLLLERYELIGAGAAALVGAVTGLLAVTFAWTNGSDRTFRDLVRFRSGVHLVTQAIARRRAVQADGDAT